MEIQEIKDKLRSTQSKCLVCRYDRSYCNTNFVQVVLTIISDEAYFVNYINSVQNIFDDNSISPVCYVKADYFNDYMDEQLYDKNFEDETYDNQMKILNEYLYDKLIIVRPYFCYQDSRNMFFKNGNVVDVIDYDDKIPNDLSYMSIPIIKNKSIYEKLIKKEDFPLQAVSREIMGNPEYIFYNNEILKVKLESLESNDCYWHAIGTNDSIEKLDINFEELEKNNDIILLDEGEFIYVNRDKLYAPKTKLDNDETEKINNEKNTIEESDDDYGGSINTKMINEFNLFIKKSNLCYSLDDIYNFFTCVYSSQLIILAGMSGTGKTKLPLKFAEFFSMNEKNNKLLFLPISPSYTEPSDILGYLNPNNGIYNASETRLVDFLKHAEKNKNEMHMVIFDEMNLSQIEFWFAPFISILEKDVADRKLHLYSNFQRCINDEKYPPVINIGKNIIFVGTINLDETTKNISDRLLDRAYIINLKKSKFSEYYAQQSNKSEDQDDNIKISEKDFMEYMPKESATDRNYITTFTLKQLEFFDRIHEELNKIDNQKGISFRSVKNIALYLINKPKDFDDNKAFDYAFKQTVMQKINGTVENVGEFLGFSIDENEKIGILEGIFNEFSEISDFKECRLEIRNKNIELRKYGYAR